MTMDNEREAIEAARDWLSDNREIYVTYGPMQFAAFAFEAGAKWQARARVGKGEVGTLPFNGKPIGMEITSQKIWIGPMRKDGIKVDEILCGLECGDEYKVEYCESQKEKADFLVSSWNAALSAQAKPVEVGELVEYLCCNTNLFSNDIEEAAQAILNKYNVTEK